MNMPAFQTLAVAVLVAACAVYSAWALMPASLRRGLACRLARLGWVGRLRAVARAARGPVGCGCDGCDRSVLATGAGEAGRAQVVRVVPRRPAP